MFLQVFSAPRYILRMLSISHTYHSTGGCTEMLDFDTLEIKKYKQNIFIKDSIDAWMN